MNEERKKRMKLPHEYIEYMKMLARECCAHHPSWYEQIEKRGIHYPEYDHRLIIPNSEEKCHNS
jgi:hypothetical protein